MVDSHRVSSFIVLSLIVVLGLFPAETRGESMAGCAALVALLALLRARQVPAGAGHVALTLAPILAWPLIVSAVAPGSAVVPVAVAVVAITVGLHTSSVSGRLGKGLTVPLTLSATAVALALYALAQKMWLLEARAERLAAISGIPDRELVLIRLGQGRAFEPFPTPAALGCYLAMVLPVTLGLAISTRGRSRWVFISATALLAAGLVSTMSVTAAAALAVAGAAGLLVKPRARRGLVVASGLALAVVVGVIALRGGGVTDLSRWDHPWRLRAGNFRIATEVIGDHPWTGVGPGGFGEVFPQYRGPDDNETQHVHDVVLELGAELGVVPGALASLAFFVLFLGPVFRRDEVEPWKRGLAVGLAAFAIQNLADFTAFLPSLLWLAALLRGLLVRPRAETAGPLRAAPAFVLGSTLAATLLATAIAGLSGLSWNARYAARVAAAEGDLAAVERHAQRATSLASWDVDSRLALAQAILTAGGADEDANREALGHAERAVALSPVRPAARFTRARARLVLGDAPGAWVDLREAERLYPEREEYRLARIAVGQSLPDIRVTREEP